MAAGRTEAPGATEDEEATAASEPLDLINKSVVKATVLLSELARHRNGITVTELAQAVKMIGSRTHTPAPWPGSSP